ncbi:MAG: hypothetical protein CL572_06870 [Alphaproteobacteria bacterium]|nr:hypothetical protein [Alphaproteobacteria bacterium]
MKNYKIIVLAFCIVINSCANKEDNKLLGQILGSAAGAYLGSKFGSGVGKDLSIILGGAVGFLVGSKIAELLDKDEQKDLNKTISDSLNNNKNNEVEEWTSNKDQNTKAEVIPLNKYDIEEKTCRDFKKIVTKNGKTIEEDSTACRDENGNWRVI